MKYNSMINMIRYHRFNNKWVLILRDKGCQAKYYIDGLFMWTRAKSKWDGRLFQKDLGLTQNSDYNDWTPFIKAPSHIPNGQLWRYYFMKWRKDHDEELFI